MLKTVFHIQRFSQNLHCRNFTQFNPKYEQKEQAKNRGGITGVRNCSAYAVLDKEFFKKYHSYFPEISQLVYDEAVKCTTEEIGRQGQRLLEYMTYGGKGSRPIITFELFNLLAPDHVKTEENMKLAYYLAWLTEIANGSLFICDDIVDQGTLRRQKLCWHLQEDVGLMAITDILHLEGALHNIIKSHFQNHPNQFGLIHYFQEWFYLTNMGQIYDVLLSKKNVSEFTMEAWKTISELKTGCSTTFHPYALAATLACNPSPQKIENMRRYLLELGVLYQQQNDFEDCFDDPKLTGKVSKDIEHNACTWLAVRTMEIGSETQKKIMMECYGKDDPECVKQVRQIYKDLKHEEYYHEFKRSFLKEKEEELKKRKDDAPFEIFPIFLKYTFAHLGL